MIKCDGSTGYTVLDLKQNINLFRVKNVIGHHIYTNGDNRKPKHIKAKGKEIFRKTELRDIKPSPGLQPDT